MSLYTTYHQGGFIPAAPAQNRDQEYDSVAATFTSWDIAGNLRSQRPLTQSEQAALAAATQVDAAQANQATLQQRAQAAIATNNAFIALSGPTNAQAVAYLQTVAKELNALIKLALGLLSDTAGT